MIEKIFLYGDIKELSNFEHILKKIDINCIKIIHKDSELEQIKNKNEFLVFYKTDKDTKDYIIQNYSIKNFSSIHIFHTFISILDFANYCDIKKIIYYLSHPEKLEIDYREFLLKTLNISTNYDIAILLNLQKFRTGIYEIAKTLNNNYNCINFFKDDSKKFDLPNSFDLDTTKLFNQALFNARIYYLNCSKVILSATEIDFGKININLMHNLNYKPIDNELLKESILTPHYHFTASKSQFDIHKSFLIENKHLLKHNIHIIPAGYPKLDKLINELKSSKSKIDSICYAPTMLMHNKDFVKTLSLQNGEKIISILLKEFKNYRIIFRPHPNIKAYNYKNAGEEYIDKILKKYSKNRQFIYDDSDYYIDTFSRSAVLISDYSSIMQTFSFSTCRPFISLLSKEFENIYKKNLGLKDSRKNSGITISSIKMLKRTVKDAIRKKQSYKIKIKEYRKKEVFNLGRSKDYIVDSFKYILENKNKKEWHSEFI